MVENEKIKGLIDILVQSIRMLKEFQSTSFEEYVTDRKIQNNVEREFERAIRCCIDIGARIIAIKNLASASTYTGIFDRLFEEKIIEYEISSKLKELVRFRNLLEYFRISPEKVYQNLQDNLEVFSEFIKRVEQFL